MVLTVSWAHLVALWAITQSFDSRAIVPPTPPVIQATLVSAPDPVVTPAPEAKPSVPVTEPAPAKPQPATRPSRRAVAPTAQPLPPAPQDTADAPAPEAPLLAAAPSSDLAESGWSTSTAPGEVATAPPPPVIELPSSDAAYLDNPRPPYPTLSKRLREQGTVVLRVRIDATGQATDAQLKRSSGFDRLDQAAIKTVLAWKYRPGTRNGTPEAMWFDIPIRFELS